MTEAQKHFRKQLLTKIHTQSQYKNIVKFGGKEAWEEWLMVRFGVDSAKHLSINELNLVNGLLQGWIYEKGKKVPCVWNGESYKADLKGRALLNPSKSTQKQLTQILALQESLGWSNAKLLNFIMKQTKEAFLSVEHLTILSKKGASSVITGLTKIAVGYVKKEKKR